jgi:hypothetical protein
VVERILASGANSVLDVGAGSGTWAHALRAAGYNGTIHAVEVWAPYVREFRLSELYGLVHRGDVRNLHKNTWSAYDVAIFGDVLEHMTKDEAVAVWNAAGRCAHAAIAIPIVHYHQGALAGNPYEVHVKDDWSHDEVLATFPGITESQPFTVTGAYWR